MKFAVCLMLQK